MQMAHHRSSTTNLVSRYCQAPKLEGICLRTDKNQRTKSIKMASPSMFPSIRARAEGAVPRFGVPRLTSLTSLKLTFGEGTTGQERKGVE